MKDVFINVKLSLKDAKKLKDLVPEVSESIDRYYEFKRIYDKTVFDLCNYMKFLSIHDFREHKSKLHTVTCTIYSFFDDDSNYSDLKNYPGNVTVEVLMAGSAASVIAMAGDKVKM